MKLQFPKLAKFFKSLKEHRTEKRGDKEVNFGTAFKVVTPKGKINRHRRRETAADAAKVGRGEAQRKADNWKQIKRKKRKRQKLARRKNRYA